MIPMLVAKGLVIPMLVAKDRVIPTQVVAKVQTMIINAVTTLMMTISVLVVKKVKTEDTVKEVVEVQVVFEEVTKIQAPMTPMMSLEQAEKAVETTTEKVQTNPEKAHLNFRDQNDPSILWAAKEHTPLVIVITLWVVKVT
jgi:hypothetical protein